MSETARIYARVSGDKQRADNTITNQTNVTRGLPAWCKKQGYELTGVYEDNGKSASAGKLHLRTKFNQMLVDAANKEFQILVVSDLDRITRTNDWGELGQIFGVLQKAGIKIAGPNLPAIDLGTSMSFAQLVTRISMGYEENRKRVEKCTIGKNESCERGELPQGRIPYGLRWQKGYRWKPEMGPLVIPSPGWSFHPEHAPLVREAFLRAIDGESAEGIGRRFELAGAKCPNGGRWHLGIIRILRGTYARGEWRTCGYPIKVPALVDDVTWYAAQAALGPSKVRGLRQTKGTYLCETLGACSCGAGLRITNRSHYVCFHHTRRRAHTAEKCEFMPQLVSKVDASVWNQVLAYFAQPAKEILAGLQAHQAEASAEEASWASDAAKLTSQLADVNAVEKTLLACIKVANAANVMEQIATNAAKRARLQAQLTTAQAAIGQATSSRSVSTSLAALVGTLKASVASASPADQRTLVTMLVNKGGIVLHQDGEVEVRLVFARGETIERAVTLRAA